MFTILDGREHFYQWDLNQKLVVDNTEVKEVHFSNFSAKNALVVEVKDGLADVPNILLQENLTIRAYAYCGECRTLFEQDFNVIYKTKPADYVYTETEIKSYSLLDERITALENKEIEIELSWEDIEGKPALLEDTSDGCTKGHKGYEIFKVDNKGNRIVTETKIYDWAVGDRIAFDFGKTYTYGFTIKDFAYASAGCAIFVNETLPVPETEETMYVWNLDKPNIGDVDIGVGAFTQGIDTMAIGKGAVALNRETNAEGNFSLAANRGTRAGYGAAAFGKVTEALGTHSFTSGIGTIAIADYQRAEGKFNVEDTEGKYALIIGGGSSPNSRKNIFTVDWNGNITICSTTLTEEKLKALLDLVK